MQPQNPQGQPNDQPGRPWYPQGQPGYPQQSQPGYPQQSQPAYPQQNQPGYPQQNQPAYPQQAQPGYPQQNQPAYPQQSQPAYPQQAQPGYPQQAQSGYPQSPGQPPAGQSSQPGYSAQGQGGYSPQQTGYPQGAPGNPGVPQNSWGNAPVGGQLIGGTGPGPGLGGVGKRAARGLGAGVMRLIVLIVGAALVAGISWGCHQFTKSDAEKVQVGQCLKLAGTSHDPKYTITSCDSMDANYKVVDNKDGSTCADENDESAWQTGKYSYHLCMQLNVKQGDCLHKALDYESKVDCSSADADLKVTKIISGAFAVTRFSSDATDGSGCGDDATKFAKYTTPDPKVVCLGPTH